jgi:hypothetical protein
MDPNQHLHPVSAHGATPARRSPVEPVDLDPSRRPGVPKERPPQPWPNSRFPPQRMTAAPSAPRHGRPNKPMPPVYGTAVPPRGVSGALRKAAYRYPDHVATHWLMLLLADRVDSWGTRAWRLAKVMTPLALLMFVADRALALPRRR